MTLLNSLVVVLCILGISGVAKSATAGPVTFYVATNGNDDWSGKQREPNPPKTNGPFATLTAARDAIRALKADGGLQQPVEVLVREGTYYLSEPLHLSAEDSGSLDCPITYKAFPGEQPILSGGKVITGWHPYEGQIMCAELPEAKEGKWKFKQLFFNGQRQIRARYPDYDPDDPLYGGWAFVEELIAGQDSDAPVFRYDPNFSPGKWAKPQQGEVFIFPWRCWVNDIVPIKQVDWENDLIELARTCAGHPLMVGNRFYVENLLEELDQPGEWCLDTETGMLYFWPPTGPVQDAEVTAPVADRLIELCGTGDQPIHHVRISGLTFTQTLALFPPPRLFWGPPTSAGYAVYLEGAEDCSIVHNSFVAVGGDAVRLQGYNARNRVVGNEISDAGAQGICLAGTPGGLPYTWRDNAEALEQAASGMAKSRSNLISRNHIHHCGVIDKLGSGVYVFGLNSVDNVISHNLIHHTAHRGIVLGFGFGRNIVEYNELHHLSLEASDTGGIMTNSCYVVAQDKELWQGNVIRYNLVREVIGCGAYGEPMQPVSGTAAQGRIWTPYYGWGIYLDWNPMNVTVYGNIAIGNTLGGMMMLGAAKDVLIENNVFVNSRHSQIHYASVATGGKTGAGEGNRFRRNIVYYADPDALLVRIGQLPNAAIIAESDYNVYFNASGGPLAIDLPKVLAPDSFAQWQELGYDTHSIVADPLFVDPANDDYRLKSDSPAFQLGFEPIPVERIGLDG